MCIFALLLTLVPVFSAGAEGETGKRTLRVGLYYGSKAVAVGNLQNAQNTGYRFGYYDADRVFRELGRTEETKISVAITQDLYLTSGGLYVFEPEDAAETLGCYHVQLPGSYEDFESAQAAAEQVQDGFVAWIAGTYYVRSGSYPSRALAREAADALETEGTEVGETSAYGYSVVVTGTTRILFQFDAEEAGETGALGVWPGLEEGIEPVTWHRGYRYYGAFRFERLDGADASTVVNVVDLEDYVKGVIPYEMSPSWPLEALKAQAVCARTYAARGARHSAYHFDVCTTTHCQVYNGLNKASEGTDQAVDETAGMMALYDGKPIDATFYSSNGGASEDAKNVWGSACPYRIGKQDPYEELVADKISGYRWTKTFTAESLRSWLAGKGYPCAEIVDFWVSKYSTAGNVIEVKVLDANNKTHTFSRERIREVFSVNSIHFSITASGGDGSQIGYSVVGGGVVSKDLAGYYAISGDGTVSYITDQAYAITADGVERLTPSEQPPTGITYTLSGAGWGHSVGLSQWGAYAMALEGYSYLDILHFYYTDITVE